MSKRRWVVGVGIVGIFGCLVTPPVHAFKFSKIFSFWRTTSKQRVNRAALPGQKVRIFRLAKAQSSDLVELLEHYLDGIHSQGSILSDSNANALVVTDGPDNLQRIEALIKAMDCPFDNPDKRARQMLASQKMLKAIRDLKPIEAAPLGASSSAVSFGGGTVSGPYVAYPKGISLQKEEERPVRRLLDEPPPLLAFYVVGWVRDEKGYIIVLRNNGQRFVFRGGRVLYGGLGNKDSVPNLSGEVLGGRLILREGTQRFVTLKMIPTHDRNGDIR